MKIVVDKYISERFSFNFERKIEGLISFVPKEHIYKLEKIIITEHSPEKKQKEAYGLYYGTREGAEVPTIVICANNVFKNIPRIIFYLAPFIPLLFLADTLYHEIFHHYQRISHGYKKEKWENTAEKYSKEMSKKVFMSSNIFKAIKPLKFIIAPLIRILRKKNV